LPDLASRYAGWPRRAALAVLALWLALIAAAALTPIRAGEDEAPAYSTAAPSAALQARTRDEDLQLYDEVIARLRHGETYYGVIAEEHRRHRFPLHPGFAVRLPTLAVIEATLPEGAMVPLSMLLTLAVMLAWWRKLGGDPAAAPVRTLAIATLLIGATVGMTRYFFVLHELWAGQILALAFGLHRPERGQWFGAWLAAALALAIREHALPFVLLMAAMALWQRRWREGAAWSALALLFTAAMAVHLHAIAQLVLPTDAPSASWMTLRGLSGWLSMLVLSSNLRLLPHTLGGALVVASLMGWSGWKSSAGLFGFLLQAGYGLAFMLAGRGDNFYWGMVIAPTLLVGLAFIPATLRDLWRAATSRKMPIALGGRGVQRT